MFIFELDGNLIKVLFILLHLRAGYIFINAYDEHLIAFCDSRIHTDTDTDTAL